MSTNLEYRSIYLQRVDHKHICLFFCFFVFFFVPESLLNPFGNVQFIQKWHYYSLKSLLLSKQHHQTTEPRSLLHKSMLEDNWIFGQSHVFSPLERCKFLGYNKITFLSPKKNIVSGNNIIKRQNQCHFYKIIARLKRSLEFLLRIMG